MTAVSRAACGFKQDPLFQPTSCYSLADTAGFLDITIAVLKKLIAADEIVSHSRNGHLWITEAAIEDYTRRSAAKATP